MAYDTAELREEIRAMFEEEQEGVIAGGLDWRKGNSGIAVEQRRRIWTKKQRPRRVSRPRAKIRKPKRYSCTHCCSPSPNHRCPASVSASFVTKYRDAPSVRDFRAVNPRKDGCPRCGSNATKVPHRCPVKEVAA